MDVNSASAHSVYRGLLVAAARTADQPVAGCCEPLSMANNQLPRYQ